MLNYELVKIMYDDQEMPVTDIKVKVDRNLNEHDKVSIKCMMQANQYDKYVENATSKTKIGIDFTRDGESVFIFKGRLKSISANMEGSDKNSVFFVLIDAIANTANMDLKLLKKSFQDKNMTYSELVSTVIQKYERSDKKMEVGEGVPIEYFTLQYRETDWQFLKRMASRFYSPLVCESTADFPKFKFGLTNFRDRGTLENYNYSILKQINDFRYSDENKYIEEINELDFITYKISFEEEQEPLSIGDRVSYKGLIMYISKSVIEIKDNNLYNTIFICTESGLKQNIFYNEAIIGISIIGKVLDAKQNMLKLHLEIDDCQGIEKAWWFDYATFYSTWYCMPEINDFVNLHFPKNEEVKAIAINSIKQKPTGGYDRNNSVPTHPSYNGEQGISGQGKFGADQEGGSQSSIYSSGVINTSDTNTKKSGVQPIQFEPMATDPTVKMITTQDGKTIALGSDRITIDTAAGTYIELKDDGGIVIYTLKDIDMYASNNIKIECENELNIEAKEVVRITCEGSELHLRPDFIVAKSKNVNLN